MKTFRMRDKERSSTLELTITADDFKGTKFDAMTATMWEITRYHIAHGRIEDIRCNLGLMLDVVEDAAERRGCR